MILADLHVDSKASRRTSEGFLQKARTGPMIPIWMWTPMALIYQCGPHRIIVSTPGPVDSLGMVILETQASGVPALVPNIGGPQEIILDGKTGHGNFFPALPSSTPGMGCGA